MRGRYRNANSSLSCLSYWPETSKRIKKCFVYKKISCWSTNYTQQERDELKEKFGDCYPEYKIQLGYEQNLQRQITEYEVVDNNEILTHYFGDLSINIHNDFMLESKSFYTKLEQFHTALVRLEGSKSKIVINTLADNTFKYQIILSDETLPLINVPAFYVFNLLTDSQYNNTQFKKLLIELGASSQLTSGIDQLKALQQLDTSVQLDRNKAGSAKFTFKIGSIISIKLVILDIQLVSIIFHIVSIKTLFLLCLANMDKLKTFFDNIINQLIQTLSLQSHPVI